ncbi:hypothetical protein [Acidovorax carolinensis]|nr:hypothetical protein [Acidovorax carolinensis]
MDEVIRRRGPLHRVGASDFAVAEEVLKTAALLIVPEDQTQRQAFEKLLPHLYVLRNKGCSFAQLAKLLGEVGIKLQPSTVRSYFSEMLAARMDVCQAKMNEQIALMAAIRSETAGADVTAISGRVNAYLERLQSAAAPKVDALFGTPSQAGSTRTIEMETPRPQISAPVKENLPVQRAAFQRPPTNQAPQNTTDDDAQVGDNPTGEFGLLGLASPQQRATGGPAGFFTLDAAEQPAARQATSTPRDPAPPAQPSAATPATRSKAPSSNSSAAPPQTRSAAPASSSGATKKRLSRLQEGVPPLKRRDNVPAHVYEPGELEHPAIPGLMLNLEQRLYGAALEYYDEGGPDAGEIRMETTDQKRFRVVWRQAVPMTQTRTAQSFTQMDTSLFPGKPPEPK